MIRLSIILIMGLFTSCSDEMLNGSATLSNKVDYAGPDARLVNEAYSLESRNRYLDLQTVKGWFRPEIVRSTNRICVLFVARDPLVLGGNSRYCFDESGKLISSVVPVN